MLCKGLATVADFPRNAGTTLKSPFRPEIGVPLSGSLLGIELFGVDRGEATSVTQDAHEPIPQVACINAPLSHRLATH